MAFDDAQGIQVGRYLAECAAYPLPRRVVLHSGATAIDYGDSILFARRQDSFLLDHPVLCAATRSLLPGILTPCELDSALAATAPNCTATTIEFCLRFLARNQVVIESSGEGPGFISQGEQEIRSCFERAALMEVNTRPLFATGRFAGASCNLQAVLLELRALPMLSRKLVAMRTVVAVHTGGDLLIVHHSGGAGEACVKCLLMRLGMLTNISLSRITRFYERRNTPVSRHQLDAFAACIEDGLAGTLGGALLVSADGQRTPVFPLPVPNCEFCAATACGAP